MDPCREGQRGVLCLSCTCINSSHYNTQVSFSQTVWLFSYSQKINDLFLIGNRNLSRQYIASVFSCFHYFFKWHNLSSKIYLRLLYHQLPGLLYTLLHVRRTGGTYLVLINSTWLETLPFNNLHQCHYTGTAGESHKSSEIKSLTIETSWTIAWEHGANQSCSGTWKKEKKKVATKINVWQQQQQQTQKEKDISLTKEFIL